MTPREHLLVADELHRLLSLTMSCESGETVIRLYDLADLILRNPISRSLLDSYVAEELDPHEIEKALLRKLAGSHDDLIEELFAFRTHISEIASLSVPEVIAKLQSKAIKKPGSWLRRHDPDVLECIAGLEEGYRRTGELSLEEFKCLREAVDEVGTTLRALVGIPHPEMPSYSKLPDKWKPARDQLANDIHGVQGLIALAERFSIRSLVENVQVFHADVKAFLSGDVARLYERGLASSRISDMLPGLERLVSRMRSRLALAPIQANVVDRLVTYLERFDKHALMSEIIAQHVPGERHPAKERIVQEHVDRFLFLEGFFPIIHPVAGGQGHADTMVPETLGLELQEAERKGLYPLLFELKQSIALPKEPPPDGPPLGAQKTTQKAEKAQQRATEALQEVAKLALHQAEQYRKTMVSYPRWSDLEVFVIVVHNTPGRPSLPMDGVRFVYVGDTTPSNAR